MYEERNVLVLLFSLEWQSHEIVNAALPVRFVNKSFRAECVSGLDQLEQTSQPKPSSVESDSCQDGKINEDCRRKNKICFLI